MTADASAPTKETFRHAIARWATGVSVVTTRGPGGDYGLTVNGLLSVSLAPPLLLVSLSEDADSTPIVQVSGLFAVNLLREDQRALSERFAETVPSAEKFRELAVRRSALGLPLIDPALAVFECRVQELHPVADHVLVVGEVVSIEEGSPGSPLLFFQSRYARIGREVSPVPASAGPTTEE